MGSVAGILSPRYTSTIVTTMINCTIVRGRVNFLKRPMFTSSITYRHFKTFILWNTIIITMVGGIMAGLTRPKSKNSITTHHEINFSTDRVGYDILVWSMTSGNEMSWNLGINYISRQGSMVQETGLLWGSATQWHQGIGIGGWTLAGVAIYSTVSIIGAPHGDLLLSGFVWLQRK